jgi:hypothetical protein
MSFASISAATASMFSELASMPVLQHPCQNPNHCVDLTVDHPVGTRRCR